MGAAEPQSELLKHSTHCPGPARHRGWLAGQSEFTAHATHCEVVASQMGAPAAQSDADRHPTHTPLPEVVTQKGVLPPLPMPGLLAVQSAFVAQEAWHWWSPGQHAGVAAGQSAFARQPAHRPVLTTQNG